MSVIAKSIVIDMANNWGHITFIGIRDIALLLSSSRLAVTPGSGSTAYGNSISSNYLPDYAFQYDASLIGDTPFNGWLNAATTNQRIILVFDTPAEFDEIVINNYHDSGGGTTFGVRDCIITISSDAITDTTYGAAITNSEVLFDGVFTEHEALNQADPEAVYPVINIALSELEQIYGDAPIALSELEQIYGDVPIALSELEQIYGLRLYSPLEQPYGDFSVVLAELTQYYKDALVIRRELLQPYQSSLSILSELLQPYILVPSIVSELLQPYFITSTVLTQELEQIYDILQNNPIESELLQHYNLISDSRSNELEIEGFINGNKVHLTNIDIEMGYNSYTARCVLVLSKYSQWVAAEYLQPVIIIVNGVDYNFIISGIDDSQDINDSTFRLEARSSSILLDFPYAEEVPSDFVVSGTASEVVNDLAALEGKTIQWELPIDPPLNSDDLQVAGESPLSKIRTIINVFGGILYTDKDEVIHAVLRYEIDVTKYEDSVADILLTAESNFKNISSVVDKRDGYNKFFISDEQSGSSYDLRTESISTSNYTVKAFKVPWVDTAVELKTSELTNIEIKPLGIIEEIIEEDLVITNGESSTTYPVYGIISQAYTDRTDLGVIVSTEEGRITSSINGNSIVTLKYTTRYWLWDTFDTDSEKVQFILVTP